jgi:hypothetical protein
MRLADRASKSLSRSGNGNPINVIGHQTICPDLDLLGAAPLGQQLEVTMVIFVTKESPLSMVSPFGDVVRGTSYNNSRHSCHGRRQPVALVAVNN